MLTLARAYLELASYIQIAKFDDPDDHQGAIEYVTMIIQEGSDETVKDILMTIEVMMSENRVDKAYLKQLYECARQEVENR